MPAAICRTGELSGNAAVARSAASGPAVEILGWILEDPALRQPCPPLSLPASSPAAAGIRMCTRSLWSRPRERWRRAVKGRVLNGPPEDVEALRPGDPSAGGMRREGGGSRVAA